ncbi:MAG: hypothetical protein ALECFALPRED_006207 [Alectoria fallacina]|uniref:Uncharacterized protein n=1 Tax=Alectoria fallacina TaxID=1903189 RepID=A0A8H3G397_9LECA|nr:MAG: hypothetical protein ALECFALPRED_006207 [Alectoria fallacina]
MSGRALAEKCMFAYDPAPMMGWIDVDKAVFEKRDNIMECPSLYTTDKNPSTKLQDLVHPPAQPWQPPSPTQKTNHCSMQLISVALAFAALSLSALSAPTAIIDERSPDAKADAKAGADHAYAIEVEGMLARLEKRGLVEKRSADTDADAKLDHAYPIEVEGMLAYITALFL